MVKTYSSALSTCPYFGEGHFVADLYHDLGEKMVTNSFFFYHLIYSYGSNSSFTTNSCYLTSSAEAQHDFPDYAGLVFSFLPFAANFSEFFCYFYIWPYVWSSLFWTIDRSLGAKFLTKAIVLNLLHLEAADEHNCHFYYPGPTNLYYYVYCRYSGISPDNIKLP